MANRGIKLDIAVVHAQNTQKTHNSHASSSNVETATKKHMYKDDTANVYESANKGVLTGG